MAKLSAYTILVQDDAERDLDEIIRYVARGSPLNAGRLTDRFTQRICSLEKLPRRCPLARENGSASLELRQLLVGPYRIVFGIIDQTVHVLRVIHASRDTLPPDQIPDPY